MTIERRADLVLPTVLGDLAGNASPDYLDDVLSATAQMRQPRAWSSIQRWFPTSGSDLAPAMPWRGLVVALVIIALLVASLAILAGSGKKQLPEPFGLAATGLVAFEMGGDIVATLPDGSGRRTLIADAGFQFGHQWSPRGDRIRLLVRTEPGGSGVPVGRKRRRLGPAPRLRRAGPQCLRPASQVSWSPDDERLVFTVGGPEGSLVPSQLYVVNADGSDLHLIGEPRINASDPVWSPDGSLIAYNGQPVGDPYSTTSTLGHHARRARLTPRSSRPRGGTRSPTSTPAGRRTAGRSSCTRGDAARTTSTPTPTSRSPVGTPPATGHEKHRRRDGVGTTSRHSRPPEASSRSSGSSRHGDPAEYVVMVADADGSHVRQLSTQHVAVGHAVLTRPMTGSSGRQPRRRRRPHGSCSSRSTARHRSTSRRQAPERAPGATCSEARPRPPLQLTPGRLAGHPSPHSPSLVRAAQKPLQSKEATRHACTWQGVDRRHGRAGRHAGLYRLHTIGQQRWRRRRRRPPHANGRATAPTRRPPRQRRSRPPLARRRPGSHSGGARRRANRSR